MKKISLYLAFGFTVVALLLGLVIGYYLTPEYKASMYSKNEMSLGQAGKTFDLRYINAMIAHHQGAILLAEQLGKNTIRGEMKGLSEAIIKDEPVAIAELYQWKKDWYGDTRVVRDPVVANLGGAGETFDLRFLNAMIMHHEAGILMTEETRQKSNRALILDNADAVEQFLEGGLEALKGFRKDWYNV